MVSPSSRPADLVDLVAAGEHLGIPPGTLRVWVHRYEVPRWGTERRRGLYSLSDLLVVAGKLTERNPRQTSGA